MLGDIKKDKAVLAVAKKKRNNGLEKIKEKYGYTFVIHYALGLILFFAYPLISSVVYSFSDVRIEPGKIINEFVGTSHFKTILMTDPNYLNDVRDSLGYIFFSLPVIIAMSLVLAVLLNKEYHGRAFVRTVFFLPIIISGSAVMAKLDTNYLRMPLFSTVESGGAIDYKNIIANLNVPDQVSPVMVFLIANTIDLIWNCGVQTLLFLAGLQSIPASMYEVSKIEGANKWDEFWMITVPSLRNIISLVLVYTMIELFTASDNTVVSKAYAQLTAQNFGEGSAMLWFYFVIVIAVIALIYTLYHRFCIKRWE